MTKEEIHQAIGILRTKYQKSINNLYIWSSIAIDSLDYVASDEAFLSQEKYEIPSKKSSKTVSRDKDSLIKIIKNAKDYELNQAVFSYLVAQIEAFFQELLYAMLCFDNKKLSVKINRIDNLKKIDVLEV